MVDNSGTNVVFHTLNGEINTIILDVGGIKNNEATNYTGDVNIDLQTCTDGDSVLLF